MAKINPKAFFQYVSSKTTNREPIANLVDAEGNLTASEQEKAEVLKDFFSSVFTREPGNFVPDFSTTSSTVINTVNITVESMLKKLQSLNPCKSPGPDGLHPKILKELVPALAYPMTDPTFYQIHDRGQDPLCLEKPRSQTHFQKRRQIKPGQLPPRQSHVSGL